MARRALAALAFAAPLALCQPNPSLAAGPGGSHSLAWVSSAGSDATGCGAITAPCRSFQYAHDSIVEPGGTIYVKDPGDYVPSPPLLIQHAISIINDGGGPAIVAAALSDAIQIQAGAADNILIKGLILDGDGTGNDGINFMSGGGLTVTNTTVKGFAGPNGGPVPGGHGIIIQPASGNVHVNISDTSVIGNSYNGIFIVAGGFRGGSTANVMASLTRVQVSGNLNGVVVANNGTGTVNVIANQVTASNNAIGPLIANNDGNGFYVYNSRLYLTRCVASGNITGVWNGGAAYSAGDNAIYNNTTNVDGGLNSAPLQ